MNNGPRLKEHLTNLLNALTNLSPSRNIISQLTLLLPRDLTTVENSFPEFNDPKPREVLNLIGIEFGDQVKRHEGSFAEALYKYLHVLFNWLDDEDVRVNIAKLADLPVTSIPNPYAEWAKGVLAKFKQMPNGDKVLKFLSKLVSWERNSFIVVRRGFSRGALPPDWPTFLDEVSKELKLNPAELEEILRLTIRVPNLSESITLSSDYNSLRIRIIEHSEYHLDIITSEEWLYHDPYRDQYELSFYFNPNHKRTIKKLLEEIGV